MLTDAQKRDIYTQALHVHCPNRYDDARLTALPLPTLRSLAGSWGVDVAAADRGELMCQASPEQRRQLAGEYWRQHPARQVETLDAWRPPPIAITGKPLGMPPVVHLELPATVQSFRPQAVCLKTDPDVMAGKVTSIDTVRIPR